MANLLRIAGAGTGGVALVGTTSGSTPKARQPHAREGLVAYGKLPMAFEANEGQSDPRVKFLSRGPGYALFLTATEAVLSLPPGEQGREAHACGARRSRDGQRQPCCG